MRLLPFLGCRAVQLGAAQGGQAERHPVDVDHVVLVLLQAKDPKIIKILFRSQTYQTLFFFIF